MEDRYYPIFIRENTLRVLVVGGGSVAARKVGALLEAGAQITLVSPEIVPALAELSDRNKITWIRERYDSLHIGNIQLIIGATDNDSVNARIADDATRKGIPVNIVDDPALSTVIMPSVMNSGPLTVAVGTSGAAPELARKIRMAIEDFLPAAYPIILAELKALRPRIKKLSKEIKRGFWQQVTNLDYSKFIGPPEALVTKIRQILASCENPTTQSKPIVPDNQQPGKIFLVGAGPGDPGLLTIKGRDCLRGADVVIYDHLADLSLLSHVPERCEKIFVGKSASRHIKEQDAINAIMVERAGRGNIVVRLKGGDPFIFGRGGEECDVLGKAGVPYEVVPGVTSGTAAPAYAGIPLTYRGMASSVAFVTGHREKTDALPQIRWEHLAKGADTLVFFMGLTNLPKIADELVANGKSPDTPACVIQWGTKQNQKTIVGTLGNIVNAVEDASIQPPAIIVVGEVVRLRDKLHWFEQLQHSQPTPPA